LGVGPFGDRFGGLIPFAYYVGSFHFNIGSLIGSVVPVAKDKALVSIERWPKGPKINL